MILPQRHDSSLNRPQLMADQHASTPAQSPESTDTQPWFTVEPIDSQTYALSEYGQWMKLHSYLFLGSERAMLVDTGLGIDNIKTTVSQLTDLPVTVLSTHAHWDHIGGHAHFTDIWVHEAETEWLTDGYGKEAESIREYLAHRSFTQTPPESFRLEAYEIPQCQASGIIQDGQCFDLGNRTLKAYHTPGHSPGHVCFHDEAKGYLATGDLIYQGTLLAGLTDSDPEAYLDSLRRARGLQSVNQILPGHGRLGLKADLLEEAETAFTLLKNNGKLKKESGMHPFRRILIQL